MKKKYSLKQLLNEELEQMSLDFEDEVFDFDDDGEGFGDDVQEDVYLSDEIPDDLVEFEFGEDGMPWDESGDYELALEDLLENNNRGKTSLTESLLLTEAIKAQNIGGIKGMVMTLDFLVRGSSGGWTAGPAAKNFKKSFAKAGSISAKDVTMAPSSAIGAQAWMDVKYAGQSLGSTWSQKS